MIHHHLKFYVGGLEPLEHELEGDIRACFDGISHSWLLTHIPMDRVMLQKWLKAGFVDKQVLYPTEAGVPHGGIATLPTKLRKAC